MLFGVAAFAENPLDCVDADVLRGLIFRGTAEQVVSTELPEEMASLNIPAGFSWIGSLERNLGSAGISPLTTVTAAYRTRLSADAARIAALDALTADGWTLQPGQQGMGMGAFTSASQPTGQTACRDNQPITVTTNALDGTTYVVYAISRGGGGGSGSSGFEARSEFKLDDTAATWRDTSRGS